MSKKKILLICLAILLGGIAVTALIFSTEPEAEREGASIETAMLVGVTTVNRGTFEPVISATGTVRPVEDIILSPLVPGQIIRRDPAFTPGGFVKKNQVLLQIDPADYQNTLELRKSELLQSQTALDTEMGRQQIARQDLKLIAEDSLFGADPLSAKESELVLRKPQLNAVKATIKASEAAVSQAALNLSRTTIRAPFNAHILSKNVTLGSQVAQGDDLGRLVGTEYYWINATVPISRLQYLRFTTDDTEQGSEVRIQNPSVWGSEAFRIGHLDKQIGALDDQTRLARVLVRVADPLSYTEALEGKPKLMIGTFVDVSIQAEPLTDVIRLDRDHVRSNETVWVMKAGKLNIRKVEIVLSDNQYAYIKKGLEDGEQVVTTNLSTVSDGIELRTEGAEMAKKIAD